VYGQIFKLRLGDQEWLVSTQILQGFVLPMPTLAESAISRSRVNEREISANPIRDEIARRDAACK